MAKYSVSLCLSIEADNSYEAVIIFRNEVRNGNYYLNSVTIKKEDK